MSINYKLQFKFYLKFFFEVVIYSNKTWVQAKKLKFKKLKFISTKNYFFKFKFFVFIN